MSVRLSRGTCPHPRHEHVLGSVQKKIKKIRDGPLLSSVENHNRGMKLPQRCCVTTIVLKVLERHSQDFHR